MISVNARISHVNLCISVFNSSHLSCVHSVCTFQDPIKCTSHAVLLLIKLLSVDSTALFLFFLWNQLIRTHLYSYPKSQTAVSSYTISSHYISRSLLANVDTGCQLPIVTDGGVATGNSFLPRFIEEFLPTASALNHSLNKIMGPKHFTASMSKTLNLSLSYHHSQIAPSNQPIKHSFSTVKCIDD